ncbi:MAG: fucose isomerase, partial [Acidobacteria bacterium]|nr:fucose isomerase [Acidobacteriota bacterium]
MITRPTTLGVIVGNRGFFPSHLCATGRTAALDAIERAGLGAVALAADATPHGSVETLAEARACA